MTQEDLYALLPFVLLALVFWFLVFRPARKRQRETLQTQSSLEVGARVMLTSGIFGDVLSVGDSELEIEIAPGTVITVHRQAIGRVVTPDDATDDAALETRDADDSDADDVDDADDTAPTEQSEPELPTHEEK
ncbi:preprotein translocase subunit YajC [Solicola gregarius]|uniref:Preprotein translocase subunit YajC n=1 Tax=Solicola gregarius TaxID=2908642 RepID=A0AA46TGK5_9ACTN|nr:preprotein translocase subunit YajC [Solicola gregarius]UYM04803.1 preprotein translocase subunit YajC [Solicola gregarius]